MPFIDTITLSLTEEQLWRGQGGRKPEQVRPALRALMNRALEEALPLLQPRLAYELLAIEEVQHDRLVLQGGAVLHSAVLAAELALAERVAVAGCTIGRPLDERVRELLQDELALASALDGVGSAAVDALSAEVCCRVDEAARQAGALTTMPFSPGEGEWPLSDQQAVLGLLPADSLGIQLSPDFLMTPLKSLTMVIGVGKEVRSEGVPCDRCSAALRCRYRVNSGAAG
jgi:hypothetical protein